MSTPVVAAGHPATVEAAAALLRDGANAFDAAVAAGFAAAAAEPGLTSLGGGGFLLGRTAEGEERVFDFFVDTPGLGRHTADLEPHFTPVPIRFLGAEQVFNVGYGSVAVPGCLAGYLHAHERWGHAPLAAVVEPARALAAEGLEVNHQQAELFGLLEPILTLTGEGRALFAPDGAVPAEGDRFRNPDLAAFLADLASERRRSGPGAFERGDLATSLAGAMAERGGLLTEADLLAYRVVERRPLTRTYRDARLATNPQPSFGGTLVGRALSLLEMAGPAATAASPEHAVRMAQALREIARHRVPGPAATRGTTHVSVCDAAGNVASMTTSNGSGSGVVVPGTGIMLNNMMGEHDLHPEGFHSAPPGQRVGSMMAPSILVADGQEPIALGSGGSERIRSALTQVVAHLVDDGVGLDDAVCAPRMHWDGTTLQVEPGLDHDVLAALAETMPVNVWERPNLYFGGVHAASPSGACAGDPRRGGCTALPEAL